MAEVPLRLQQAHSSAGLRQVEGSQGIEAISRIDAGHADESRRSATMTDTISDWAKTFLREDRVGMVGTLNADGSPHLSTMWYLLADDGTVIMTTLSRNQKVKNLRRDPRITFCVGDRTRSVSLSGRVTISEDQAVIRQDLERLVERYVSDKDIRPRVVATWIKQPHVALHFKPEKVTGFSVSPMR